MPNENKPLAVYASFSMTGIKTRILNESLTSELCESKDALSGALQVMQQTYPDPVACWRKSLISQGHTTEEVARMTPPQDYQEMKASVDAFKEPVAFCVWMRNNVHYPMTSPTKMRNRRILPVSLMEAHSNNMADANIKLEKTIIPDAIANLDAANGWAEIAAGQAKLRQSDLIKPEQLAGIRVDHRYLPMSNPDQFIKEIASSLSEEKVEQVRRQLEAEHRIEMQIAEQDMLAQIAKNSLELAESIGGGSNRIQRSVEKIVEMAEFSRAKNIGGNSKITEACDRVTTLLGSRLADGTVQLNAQIIARIRSDSSFRGQVSESLSNIAEFTLGSRKL